MLSCAPRTMLRPRRYRFMLSSLAQRAESLERRVIDMQASMTKAFKLPSPAPVGVASQQQVLNVGRICSETEGKLSKVGVLLEGSHEQCAGARVPMSLKELRKYSLFPGQVVAVKGVNSTGTKLIAQDLCEVCITQQQGNTTWYHATLCLLC